MKCPDCGAPMVPRSSRYGDFLGCTRFPKCRGSHGIRGGEAMGIPADKETRKARVEAHEHFDALWKGDGPMSRRDAYRWLQTFSNLPPDEAHISRFTKSQCEHLIEGIKAMDPN